MVGARPEEGSRVIEVNARLGGDRIPELVRLATGLDLTRMHVDAVLGRPVVAEPTAPQVAAIRFLVGPGGGTLHDVRGLSAAVAEPGVAEVHVRVGVGTQHRLNGSNQDRVAWSIAVGPHRDAALARASAALDRLEFDWAQPAGSR